MSDPKDVTPKAPTPTLTPEQLAIQGKLNVLQQLPDFLAQKGVLHFEGLGFVMDLDPAVIAMALQARRAAAEVVAPSDPMEVEPPEAPNDPTRDYLAEVNGAR